MAMMKAAVMTRMGHIEMQEREIPAPKPGEALIRVKCVGVCGSDLHFFESGRVGQFECSYPFVLGHESAGEVVALGEGVEDLENGLAVGDRVALEPGVTCGVCEYCKAGLYNLCAKVEFFAAPPYDGTLLEYVAHPADLCFKLPDNVSYAAGALVEPLAVGLHAAKQGGASLSQTAVVTGSGCIGLCSLLALKASGVQTVYVTDVATKRLAIAEKLGGIPIDVSAVELESELKRLNGGVLPDLLIETSGNAGVQSRSPHYVKRGGTIVLVGFSTEETVPMELGFITMNEIAIREVHRYRNLYPVAIKAIEYGLPVEDIVTDAYGFSDTSRAFHESSTMRDSIVKAVINL